MRNKWLIILLIGWVLGVVVQSTAFSQTSQQFKLYRVVSGLGIPWGMDFLMPDLAVVTEKKGVMWLLQRKDSVATTSPWIRTKITGAPAVIQIGQGGLLDVRFAPKQFWESSRPLLFFTYVSASTKNGNKGKPTLFLGSAELMGHELLNKKVLFEANTASDNGVHFGSRIAFDNSGHVFFSIGDRGRRQNSQDLRRHAGSILRLKIDGSVPADNPFVNQQDAMPEIWSYGHRNPQGLFFDQATNKLWSIEHGPRGGDEINLIAKGGNYGWPVISYGREYISNLKVSASAFKEGMEQPVHYYVPSIAPSSLLVYSGKRFPQFRGNLFSGALKLRHLNVVIVNSKDGFEREERWFTQQQQRIRNVVENSDGDIFIATDNGEIFQLVLLE